MKFTVFPRQGYRKFWLAALSLVLSAIFVLLGIMNGSEWNVAIGLILGIGGLSNVGEHLSKKKDKDA
jgi:hypothetical protein